jgi:hypothetical protein
MAAERTPGRLTIWFIVLELTTAVVLLVGAGLLAKSFYLLLHVDLGFKPDHLGNHDRGSAEVLRGWRQADGP